MYIFIFRCNINRGLLILIKSKSRVETFDLSVKLLRILYSESLTDFLQILHMPQSIPLISKPIRLNVSFCDLQKGELAVSQTISIKIFYDFPMVTVVFKNSSFQMPTFHIIKT